MIYPRDILVLLFSFADDAKLMQKLIFTTSHNELQDDINRLIEWYKKWELKFNSSKCKVMPLGMIFTFKLIHYA